MEPILHHEQKRPREERQGPPAEKRPRTENIPDRERSENSPARARRRPGHAARVSRATTQALFSRQRDREASALATVTQNRGVDELVRQHYNAVPERGRDWRKTDSRIKGLRSFNNWVKSTIIQKFSPVPAWDEVSRDGGSWEPLHVLDIGCGKGGDLGKWAQAPQPVGMYIGIDPAEVSIEQARDRYAQMRPRGPPRDRGGQRGGRPGPAFEAAFLAEDAFAFSLGDLPLIRQIGFGEGARWGPSGGFDVVSMMFCMHYAYETEAKAKGMLNNVASCLKKGGRFMGVIPNSDVIREGIVQWHADRGSSDDQTASPTWGNSLYNLCFPPAPPGKVTPADGVFRPPYGWKYSFFLHEAVEEVPEYIVPWEAFRAIAEDYNLELQYRKTFREIWEEEGNTAAFGPLSERMGVRERDGGALLVTPEEMEVAGFYHAFCFYKV